MNRKKITTIVPTGMGEFLVYVTEDGRVKLEVRLQDETVWLTQQLMAELFQTTQQNVSQHIQNIYEEGELEPGATYKKFLSVRHEGSRQVQRSLDYYNLDISINFFKTVQNKMHWAITGRTAAEIVHSRADAEKANMGLTNFRGAKVRKQDVFIAKNYLDEEELAALNNLVEQYLIFAEGQSMRRIPMHMTDWIAKLDAFLNINDREILTHAGKITHEMAKQLAEDEYEKFSRKRIAELDRIGNDFDKLVTQLSVNKKEKEP